MRPLFFLSACATIALSLPARAEESSDSGAGGEAIIVTARQRAEDEQSVPVAMSVVTAQTLERSYTVNTSQLSQLVPTLNYASPNPRNTAFTIRGLGSSVVAISQANDGLEPGVGFHVDQVYHARPATAAFDFTDLDRVEVLRGPQGTVFGKNTAAGAINITTRKPDFSFGGEAELSLGEQGFVQTKASLTGPLVDDVLAFRLSGSLTRRNGSIYNVRYDKWQNNVHNDALRGQLLFTPGDDFSLRVIGDWSNFRNECCTQVFVRIAPTLKPAAQQFAALAAGAISGGYTLPSLNSYDRLTDIDADLGVDTNEGGVTAIADYKAGSATITSVSAWRFWNWDAANDRDYTGLPIQMTQHIPSRQDQFSQELRIASNQPGPVEYVAGLYYFHQKIVGHPISIYGPMAAYWLSRPTTYGADFLNGYQTDGTTNFRTDSYGVFGEVTWHVLPRLAITGGVRYTHEEKDGVYDVQAFGGGTCIASASACKTERDKILSTQYYTARISDGSPSGRVNIAYDLTDGVMAYASLAKGQKSGGINMSGLPLNAAGAPTESTKIVRPEKNTTWEGGLKTKLFDKSLILNFSAYAITVKDYQANVVDNSATVALRSYLANIPKVKVRGVEFDVSARLVSHLTLRASGAYADGHYASYANGPCPIELTGSSTARCDLTGKALPGLPKWSGSIGGEYAYPVGFGEVFLRVDANTRTKVAGDATGSAYTMIGGYALVNASIGLRADKGWELVLFARNLFDRDYLQNVTVQAGNSGLIVGSPGDARLLGVTLRIKQ